MIDRAGRLAVIAIGFSIPISTAADNVLLALVAACFVAGGSYRARLLAIRANPVSIAAVALFAALVAGAFYGPAAAKEAARQLLRYIDLLFIPLIAAYFGDAATRRLGLHALAAALAITVLLSFVLQAGLIPTTSLLIYNTVYPVVFKHNLTHTILMGFGAFLFAQLGAAAKTRLVRTLWYVLAAAAVLNIVFLVPGRTGFVVVGVLVLYLGYGLRRWTGVAAMIAVLALALVLAYGVSTLFKERIDGAVQESASWKPGVAAAESSAVAVRLEFYRNSLGIVRDHPLIGVGTGGFPAAYAERVAGTGMLATSNPHNEYLLIAVQLGAIGLALMLYLFFVLWREAPRLASPLEIHLARGLVLAMAAGCLFNSLLLDHTEGLLFAWLTGLLYAGLQSKAAVESRVTSLS